MQWTFGQTSRDIERLAYCDSLEKAAEEQRKPFLKAEAYYIRGKMASEKFEIKESNKWFFKALEIHKKLKPSMAMGKVYGYLANNAGLTHNKVDFDFFLNQAERIYKLVNSTEGLVDVKMKRTIIYSGAFGSQMQDRKAVDTYKELLLSIVPKTKNDSLTIATFNFHIGKNLINLNDPDAFKYLDVAEKIFKAKNNDQLYSIYLTQLDAMLAFKRFFNLERELNQIHELKTNLDLEKRVHYHKSMASYYSYKNNQIKALENRLAMEQIQNTMNHNSQVDFSEFYSNTETIKEQRSVISQRGFYMIIGILLIFSLFIFVIWFGRNYQIKAKQEYKSSLLVHEVNHRIKNNFQTLSNLLILQESELTDVYSKKAIGETQQRINSLALVHSHLYGKDLLERVDMQEFLSELIYQLLKVHEYENTDFKIKVNAPPLSSDKAILLGLIVNEWVTNICKYAFKTDMMNRLEVMFANHAPYWKLAINDFGNVRIEVAKKSTFGFNLIVKLVDQLEGELKYNEYNNLSEISFKSS